MDFEKHMINSLSALLKKNECLQLAFYGTLHTGSLIKPHEYYCFFGLAGNDLLVVCYSPLFHKNRFAVRVPLQVNQVKIKKSSLGGKYQLSFRLNNTAWSPFEKFKIKVKSEHPKLKSQTESVAAFLSYIDNSFLERRQ